MVKPSKVVSSLGMLGIVLGLTAGAYGFTAANKMPTTTMAGDGTANISGYTISAIHYTLNATTPSNVASVGFTVNTAPAAGSTMKVQIGGNWYSCNAAGTAISCATTTPQLTVTAATSIEAVIAD